MRAWDLQPIVLSHVNRFFSAARRASEGSIDPGFQTMLALTGNMIWANGPQNAASPEQRRAMAVVGGSMNALADRLDPGAGASGAAAIALDALECEILASMDDLLAAMVHEIEAAGLAHGSPAEISAWVWARLFPSYPWPLGQRALEHAIRDHLS